MGWYSVNYSFADPSYWGSGAGCDFATKQCSPSTWGSYFCSTQCSVTGCNFGICNGDRSAVGTHLTLFVKHHMSRMLMPFQGIAMR